MHLRCIDNTSKFFMFVFLVCQGQKKPQHQTNTRILHRTETSLQRKSPTPSSTTRLNTEIFLASWATRINLRCCSSWDLISFNYLQRKTCVFWGCRRNIKVLPWKIESKNCEDNFTSKNPPFSSLFLLPFHNFHFCKNRTAVHLRFQCFRTRRKRTWQCQCFNSAQVQNSLFVFFANFDNWKQDSPSQELEPIDLSHFFFKICIHVSYPIPGDLEGACFGRANVGLKIFRVFNSAAHARYKLLPLY